MKLYDEDMKETVTSKCAALLELTAQLLSYVHEHREPSKKAESIQLLSFLIDFKKLSARYTWYLKNIGNREKARRISVLKCSVYSTHTCTPRECTLLGIEPRRQ